MASLEVVAEYCFSGYSVDVRSKKVLSPDGDLFHLNSRAFDTLLVLLEHHGTTLSKSELMQAVWSTSVVEDNNLDQAIFTLRSVFNDTKSDSRFIVTIPGRGYCFIAPVEIRIVPGTGTVDTIEKPSALSSLASRVDFRSMALPLAIIILVGLGIFRFASKEPVVPTADEQLAADNNIYDIAVDAGMHNTIAVLPFVAMDSNKGRDMFVLDLHDALINQ